MGSTLSTIRSLLENQIDVGETSLTTDPTNTILNTYINNSIRKIVRKDKPRELLSATVQTADITINTNTVSMPTGIFYPDTVYYKYNSGTIFELLQLDMKKMIERETPTSFFKTTNTGNPNYYDVRGTSLIFNKYFSRTEVQAIKIFGLSFPTTLSEDSDTTELPIDYDLLIAYEASVLYYQKDDDSENMQKYRELARLERNDLRIDLDTNDSSAVQLDPYTFVGTVGKPTTNTDIFFGSS
jgi:hypothetical protein